MPTQDVHYADEHTIGSLLQLLSQPELNEHRWGVDDPLSGMRGVLADAMDESGREQEAQWLREPGRHVMVQNGRIVPARFTIDFAERRINELQDHMLDNATVDGPDIHIFEEEDTRVTGGTGG